MTILEVEEYIYRALVFEQKRQYCGYLSAFYVTFHSWLLCFVTTLPQVSVGLRRNHGKNVGFHSFPFWLVGAGCSWSVPPPNLLPSLSLLTFGEMGRSWETRNKRGPCCCRSTPQLQPAHWCVTRAGLATDEKLRARQAAARTWTHPRQTHHSELLWPLWTWTLLWCVPKDLMSPPLCYNLTRAGNIKCLHLDFLIHYAMRCKLLHFKKNGIYLKQFNPKIKI